MTEEKRDLLKKYEAIVVGQKVTEISLLCMSNGARVCQRRYEYKQENDKEYKLERIDVDRYVFVPVKGGKIIKQSFSTTEIDTRQGVSGDVSSTCKCELGDLEVLAGNFSDAACLIRCYDYARESADEIYRIELENQRRAEPSSSEARR